MRDVDRLRKEAGRFLLEAKQAKRQGKPEHADRLEFRAQQSLDNAAVVDAVETRLDAERANQERKVLRSARVLPFHDPDVKQKRPRWRRDKT